MASSPEDRRLRRIDIVIGIFSSSPLPWFFLLATLGLAAANSRATATSFTTRSMVRNSILVVLAAASIFVHTRCVTAEATFELYDLSAGPAETNDLSSRQSKLIREM